MEDFERAALLEAVQQWYQERFGLGRFSFGPSQVTFYDRILSEELEGDDPLYSLDAAIWTEPPLHWNLAWALLWGSALSGFLLFCVSIWSWTIFFWLGLSIGLLAVFPCIMIQSTRIAVVVEDGDDAGEEIARQAALAHLRRGFGRWLGHVLVDAALLLCWACYTNAVARLVAEEYGKRGQQALLQRELSLRERRGLRLVKKMVASMEGDGLVRLLRSF